LESNLTVQDLNARLEEWRTSLTLPIRSVYGSQGAPKPDDPAQICVQVCYYQILSLINRINVPSLSQSASHNPVNPTAGIEADLGNEAQNSAGLRICVDAARETIRLLRNIPAEFEGFLRFVGLAYVKE
jgi:hypothetical protein